MSEGRARRTKRATDRKIAQATLAIALESGPQSVTIEGVAARSGVAKTTIYRRYANREALLRGISESFHITPLRPSTPPTRANLRAIVRAIQANFEDRVGLRSVGLLLSSDSAFLQRIGDRVIRPERESLLAFFRRGVQAGVFRVGIDAEMLLDMVLGGMLMCDANTGDVPDDWPERVVDFLWPAISRNAAQAATPARAM